MKKLHLATGLIFFSSLAAANTCLECDGFNWGFSASLGATNYQNGYGSDGQSTLGRLSLETQYLLNDLFVLGLEFGIQNGNAMRLDVPKSTLDILGGEPINVVIKPTVDVLATLKFVPFDSKLFGFMKGGVAYRQLQVDRNEVNDVSKLNPELQTGLGYALTDNSYLYVGYQHIFGSSPKYQVNPVTEKGSISGIPSQDSLLIGFSLFFNNF